MVVEAGQVHGFLGPNGSGKTTTLRALLGLVNADAGRMSVLGEPAPEQLGRVAGRVGAIVESPQFFGNFTGHKTLRLLACRAYRPGGWTGAGAGGAPRSGRTRSRATRWHAVRLAVASALLKNPDC
jgi:ABC-2 type transport system ATP-binding protein